MDEYNYIAMSYGYIVDNQLMINKGPLSGRSDMVNRIDRHKRIADIEVYLWHQPKRVRVGLEIIDKITAQEYAKNQITKNWRFPMNNKITNTDINEFKEFLINENKKQNNS